MKRYAGKGLAWTLASAMVLGGLQGAGIQAAAKPKLNRTKVTLSVGKSVTLKVKRAKKNVKWSTSNKKIAKVTAKGKVKAVAPGTAKITAKTGSVKLVCKVTVKAKAEPGVPSTDPVTPSAAPSAKPGVTSPAAGTSARPAQTNTPQQSISPTQTDTPQQSTSPAQTDTPQQSTSPSQTDTPQQSTSPSQTNTPQQSKSPSQTDTPQQNTGTVLICLVDEQANFIAGMDMVVFEGDNIGDTDYIVDSWVTSFGGGYEVIDLQPETLYVAVQDSTVTGYHFAKNTYFKLSSDGVLYSGYSASSLQPMEGHTLTLTCASTGEYQTPAPSNRPADGQSSQVLPSAGASRTLTVGTMAVTMGMSMDQVHASVVNSLVRTDQNQLGMQVEVYNPGGDYQNYMLVGYADGKVALMMTISAYFSYEGILFGGDSYSKLESGDWAASRAYYKTNSDGSTQKASGSAAYEYQDSDDHVIAFMDAFGGGTTYGAMVLDSAYTLKDINEVSKGDYEDAQVIYSMEKEIYDLAMAFRVQKNVTNKKAILSENTEANLVAGQYCKDLLTGETDEDSANSYFKQNVGSWTSLASMNSEKTADAMGTLQYWIGYAACRDRLLSVPKGQDPCSYQYVGVGAAYDEDEGVATVLYLFTK